MISFRIAFSLAAAALVSIFALIVYYAGITGGRSLDFIFTSNGLRSAVGNFSEQDIAQHMFGTRVLDGVFPILYTLAICASVIRYYTGRWRFVLVLLAVIGMGVDYVENIYNLRLLEGADVFDTHVVLTWAKFSILGLPLYFALTALIKEALGRHNG